MKLSNIVISNLATFPYIQDMASAPGVSFPTNEKYNISIFIGPNGSGKSTFLEIIQQISKTVLFLPYICDIDRLNTVSVADSQGIIHFKEYRIHNLYENERGKGKPSLVYLTYLLNDDDRRNLQFVYDHQEEINMLIDKYSHTTVRFNYKNIGQYIPSYEQIVCKVQVDTLSNTARLLDANTEDTEKFIFDFFKHFHLLQHCVAIHNVLHPEPENHWHSLHATKAFIGSNRDLGTLDDVYTVGEEPRERFLSVIEDLEVSSLKNAQDHLTGLLYMKKKIAYHLFENNPNATATEIKEMLMQVESFASLQSFCKKHMRRELVVMPLEKKGSYRFLFIDKYGNETLLNDLSQGEKSILGIILTVYGYNLQEGMLVVEEPELHLHPQLQVKIMMFLEEIAQKFGLQCIMTTHSSLMINENNIRYVYRFATENNVTNIITPGKHYNEESGKLMQILKFTNTAKIFFVKKIILVEGETDEYGFGYYLHYLAGKNSYRENLLQDYEIININGKGGYARWKKFMRTFGIKSYFIGDRDNIQEVGGKPIDMRRYLALAARRGSRKGYLSKSDKYRTVIRYLKKYEPFRWDEIQKIIEDLYQKNIFVLQQGDIETYFGMWEKGLEETVNFCHNEFPNRLKNPDFDDERAELDNIFKMIFEDKKKI